MYPPFLNNFKNFGTIASVIKITKFKFDVLITLNEVPVIFLNYLVSIRIESWVGRDNIANQIT